MLSFQMISALWHYSHFLLIIRAYGTIHVIDTRAYSTIQHPCHEQHYSCLQQIIPM